MKRHELIVLAAAIVFLGIARLAMSEPTTRPAEGQARELAAKLGDDDVHVRIKAEEELRSMGKTALPALREAARSDDPEVQTRAQSLIAQIEKPAVPTTRPADRGIFLGPNMMPNVMVRGNVQILGGRGAATNIVVNENGHVTKITENADGITMSVTEPDADGKDQTKEYKAKNLEELKKEQPEAAAIYERLVKNPADMIGQQQRQLRQLMLRNRIPAAVLQLDPNMSGFGVEGESADEALREQVGPGVVVTGVKADSRAEKIGLRKHDLIQKVGGKDIADVNDLETALEQNQAAEIQVLRAGKSTTLTEKKEQ